MSSNVLIHFLVPLHGKSFVTNSYFNAIGLHTSIKLAWMKSDPSTPEIYSSGTLVLSSGFRDNKIINFINGQAVDEVAYYSEC